MTPAKRYDTRIIYCNAGAFMCPWPVSVRLPTIKCDNDCWYCIRKGRIPHAITAFKNNVSVDQFKKRFTEIIVNDKWKYEYPLTHIKNYWKQNKVLRFVREDLFCDSMQESGITNYVLNVLYKKNIACIVKTSSPSIVKQIPRIKKLNHVIVLSISHLNKKSDDLIDTMVQLLNSGIRVTISLQPTIDACQPFYRILLAIPKVVQGIEVGLYYGPTPKEYLHVLKRPAQHIARWEQYKDEVHKKIFESVINYCYRNDIHFGCYYTHPYSIFNTTRSCCCADTVIDPSNYGCMGVIKKDLHPTQWEKVRNNIDKVIRDYNKIKPEVRTWEKRNLSRTFISVNARYVEKKLK